MFRNQRSASPAGGASKRTAGDSILLSLRRSVVPLAGELVAISSAPFPSFGQSVFSH